MSVDERFGPTRRGGPVFRWLGEPLAIDLANTVMVLSDGGEVVDLLSDPTDLSRWLDAEAERLGRHSTKAGDLERIRGLRDAVRDLLYAVADGAELPGDRVALLNAASAASPVSPQLVTDGTGLSRDDRTEAGKPLTALLGALARAAIDLLATTPADELRVCRAPSCGMLFLGKRRWCCSACGNRARAARHYRRQREARGVAQARGAGPI